MVIIRLFFIAICIFSSASQNFKIKSDLEKINENINQVNNELLRISTYTIISFTNRVNSKLDFTTTSNKNSNHTKTESFMKGAHLIDYLFALIMLLFIVIIIFLFCSRRKTILTNKSLAENNAFIADLYEEIRQQFEIIKDKNKELDKYHYQLEMLVEQRTKEMMTAKNQAKESDLFKSTLLSNIYHEIRTPLNAIMGFTQLLGFDENIKNKEYLNIIDKNADNLLVLVDNIIELSKLQSENPQFEIEKVVIKDLMNKLYSETCSLNEANEKYNIEIVSDFNELTGSDLIYTNKQNLEKILKQLVDNALKYTIEGKICLSCKISNNLILFEVSDTGIGIEKEKISAIFNPFHKIEDHNNLHRGMGIGLTLAKQLSKRLNGELSVESEFKKGSKFTLSLPFNKLK
jgi:signal transduction histidine kinase